MPNQADAAIKFLKKKLEDKTLDPPSTSEEVICKFEGDPLVGAQLRSYVASKKEKGNFQTYWNRLRKSYLNKFENLDPAHQNDTGPDPIEYPRRTVCFEGDNKGMQEDLKGPPVEVSTRSTESASPAKAASPSPATMWMV